MAGDRCCHGTDQDQRQAGQRDPRDLRYHCHCVWKGWVESLLKRVFNFFFIYWLINTFYYFFYTKLLGLVSFALGINNFFREYKHDRETSIVRFCIIIFDFLLKPTPRSPLSTFFLWEYWMWTTTSPNWQKRRPSSVRRNLNPFSSRPLMKTAPPIPSPSPSAWRKRNSQTGSWCLLTVRTPTYCGAAADWNEQVLHSHLFLYATQTHRLNWAWRESQQRRWPSICKLTLKTMRAWEWHSYLNVSSLF